MENQQIAAHALAALILVDMSRVQIDDFLGSTGGLVSARVVDDVYAAFDDARQDLLRYGTLPADHLDEVSDGLLIEKLERILFALKAL